MIAALLITGHERMANTMTERLGDPPKRVQRLRTKGFRLPAGTIYVGRPTRWGNPFVVGDTLTPDDENLWPFLLKTLPNEIQGDTWASLTIIDPATAVDAYTWWLYEQPALMIDAPQELGGHDLACWCPVAISEQEQATCHADVLLALANGRDSW